jgi:hypothetical protein
MHGQKRSICIKKNFYFFGWLIKKTLQSKFGIAEIDTIMNTFSIKHYKLNSA